MLRDFSRERMDIIIQAGQSNSEGTGYGPADDPFIPDDRILYLQNDFTISRAAELVEGNQIRGNFALAFAKRYIEEGLLEEGRLLLIVRAAVGGTGFLDKRWGLEDDLCQKMMEMVKTALQLNPENRLVAFLWHQGETDADLHADYDTHYHNLREMVRMSRGSFGGGAIPFLAGNFVEQWRRENADRSEPVERAMRDVCVNAPNAAFIESDGLLSNGQKLGNADTIHFCRDALNQLGKRYFDAYLRMVEIYRKK